jgi:DNA-binding NarL/FixJ family response regulator
METQGGGAPQEALQVLIVEDDVPWARALRRHLSKAGAQSRLCTTVARAWRDFLPESVDAVVVDVGMPDGSGLAFLRDIRARGWKGPCLVQTGFSDPATVNCAHELEAEIVIKPFDVAHLACFLARASGLRHSRRASLRSAALIEASRLTPSERAVLNLLRQGYAQSAVAAMRGVAVETVKTQVRAILHKTGHRTVRQLNATLSGR